MEYAVKAARIYDDRYKFKTFKPECIYQASGTVCTMYSALGCVHISLPGQL